MINHIIARQKGTVVNYKYNLIKQKHFFVLRMNWSMLCIKQRT